MKLFSKVLAFLITTAVAFAQPALTFANSGPFSPGTTGTVDIAISGVGTSGAALVQWSMTVPAGLTLTARDGAAATAAGKSVTCGPVISGVMKCAVLKLNKNLLSDGVLARFDFTVPASGTLTFGASNTMAADLQGFLVATNAGAPVTFQILSPCDLTKDGKTDELDLTGLVMQIIGATACTTGDLTGDGQCNILDAQRLINAAQPGGVCKTGA